MGKIKDNYKSWFVKIDDFPKSSSLFEQLKFLIQFAILAPSTHNSQPWKFKIEGNKIFIQPNFNRALAVGDKENHFLYLSLGCALENLLVAASYYGFFTTIKYPSADVKFIEVVFTQQNIVDKESLIFYITKRITNRHRFMDKLPEANFLNLINDLKTEELDIDIIISGEKNDQVKLLVNTTTPALFNQPSFRKELSGYVRTNITKSKFGMPAFVMGVPTILSLFVPTILKYINIEKFQKKKQEGATNTPAFIAISTKKDNEEEWVKSGQAYQRINLLATKFNLFTQPMAAPLRGGENAIALQKILQTNFKPQFLFRLGYGTVEVRHSPRMTLDDCLVLN